MHKSEFVPISLEKNKTWPIPSSLELANAEPLHRAVRSLLNDSTLRLDGSAVERVSTPCLQVIVAAVISARAQGISPALLNPSQALSGAIAELGLSSLFNEVM